MVYISDINPQSAAAMEGNLQLLDIIHYVNGVSTQGMTLEEANRALDLSLPSVVLKATRYWTFTAIKRVMLDQSSDRAHVTKQRSVAA